MEAPVFRTLVEIQRRSCQKYAHKAVFGTKRAGRYKWLTYRELGELVDKCRGGLARLGVEKGDCVAIIANNRVEWAAGAYASYSLGAIWVPMYERQRVEDWEYILRDSEAKVLFVSSREIVEMIDPLRETIDTLEHIVRLDGSGEGSWAWLLEQGERNPCESIGDLHSDDVAGLIYTSGTTGEPKGVRLSHGNFLHNVKSAWETLDYKPDDVSVSFLPWAHSLGQTAELHTLLSLGLRTAFAESIDTLLDNFLEVHPTALLTVPAVFNRVYDKVQQRMADASPIQRALFAAGMQAAEEKRKTIDEGREPGWWVKLKVAFFDCLVFRKIRSRFGGRLRAAIVGGAALSKEVAEFIDDLNIKVYEGYGLTETAPIVSVNVPGDRRLGSAGKPWPHVKVVIDGADGRPNVEGEILVSGPNVMLGYHKRPEETEAVFFEKDSERFFRTGDLGKFDADGFLYITGRVKQLYKLANGVYVSPAPVEEKLRLSEFISQALLYGHNQPFNVALIVPDREALEDWAKTQGIQTDSFEELCRDQRVIKLFENEVEKLGKSLRPYERPKALHIVAREFTTEGGLLTPTLKLKRGKVLEQYWDAIDEIYRQKQG